MCCRLFLRERKADNERVKFLKVVAICLRCLQFVVVKERTDSVKDTLTTASFFTTGNKVDSYLEPSLSTDSWMKQDLIGPIMISRPQSAISG